MKEKPRVKKPHLLKVKPCPKCNNDMYLTGIGSNKTVRCLSCSYEEKSESTKKKETKPIEIIDVDELAEKWGTLKIKCKSCGHIGVISWVLQTRRPDEPPTQFFKCPKCMRAWKSSK